MSKYALVAIDSGGRVVLTARGHELAWLTPHEGNRLCVVEAVARGCLYLTPLDRWAACQGFPDQTAAAAAIAELSSTLEHRPEIPGIETLELVRKAGRGTPVYRMKLSATQLSQLLRPGDGPLGTKYQRHSTVVLGRSEDEGMFLWHTLAGDFVAKGGLSLFDAR